MQELKPGRNLKAGCDAGALKPAAHWLNPHGLLFCLLIAPRTTSPELALAAMAGSSYITNYENVPQAAYRQISWRHFLKRDASFQMAIALCQLDIKTSLARGGKTGKNKTKQNKKNLSSVCISEKLRHCPIWEFF